MLMDGKYGRYKRYSIQERNEFIELGFNILDNNIRYDINFIRKRNKEIFLQVESEKNKFSIYKIYGANSLIFQFKISIQDGLGYSYNNIICVESFEKRLEDNNWITVTKPQIIFGTDNKKRGMLEYEVLYPDCYIRKIYIEDMINLVYFEMVKKNLKKYELICKNI